MVLCLNNFPERSLKWKAYLKTRRFSVTIMCFIGFLIAFGYRVSVSVAIVAMTKFINVTLENGTIVEEREFNWDSREQGLVLSSFFYGYIVTQFLGGILAARFGGHIVLGIGNGVSGSLMIFLPTMAKLGLYYFITTRTLIGLFEGVSLPAMFEILSKWAPIYERTKMLGAITSGTGVGIFTSFFLSGFLAQHFGWESIFYIYGGLILVWFLLWMIYIRRDPASDLRITTEERKYIEENLEDPNATRIVEIPWKKILTSSAVYAVFVANFCDFWTTNTLMLEIPRFLSDVVKADLGTMGILAAMPYVLCVIVSLTASQLFDRLRARGILSTQMARKLGTGIGFLLTGLFLIIIPNLSDTVAIATCLILSIGISGISVVSYMTNPLDFAPNYTAIVMGISTTISAFTGIISPLLAGFIVQDGTQDQWKIVFYITAGFCAVGTLIYTLFAKGELQEWAKTSNTDTDQAP